MSRYDLPGIFRNSTAFRATRQFPSAAVAALALVALSACVTKTTLPAGSGDVEITFSANAPTTLQTGAQAAMAANVANDPQGLGVDWIASCGTPNGCGSFNPPHTASGQSTTYTAPNAPPGTGTSGNVFLEAKATASPAANITQQVTIISSISISFSQVPPNPVTSGTSVQVAATVGGDPSNAGVTWVVHCGSSTSCGQMPGQSQSGQPATYTAPTVTTNLSVTIVAEATANTAITQSVTITISPASSSGITIQFTSFPNPSMLTNQTQNMSATVSNDPAQGGVTWSVTCQNNAGSCGSFSPNPSLVGTANGNSYTSNTVYTPPTTVPQGGLTVSVSGCAVDSATACIPGFNINVTAPVVSISINQQITSLKVSGTQQFTATVNNDTSGADWTVTCNNINNICGSFNPTHTSNSTQSTTYTAPGTIPSGGGGNVTITATVHDNSQVTAQETFQIVPSGLISIAFAANQPTSSMTVGTSQNITANVSNDPVNPPGGVDWSVTCTTTVNPPDCGNFSGSTTAHTASGAAVSYTAPATVPTSGNGQVTITAEATDSKSQNPPAIVSANVTINPVVIGVTITQAGSPIDAGNSETLIAQVTNDFASQGVTWSVTCALTTGTNPCGSFQPNPSPAGTLSGNSYNSQTTYTAPTQGIPQGGVQVTITATAVASSGATNTQNVTVQPNPFNALLSGTYILSVAGQSDSGGPYAAVGAIETDGVGDITGGEEDIDASPLPIGCVPTGVPVTGGSYSIGADGRGTMTVITPTAPQSPQSCWGQLITGPGGSVASGIQTFSFAVTTVSQQPGAPARHALVVETTGAPGAGSGTLDLQSSTADLSGGAYAFEVLGFDEDFNDPLNGTTNLNNVAYGGVFSASANTLNDLTVDESDQTNAQGNAAVSGTNGAAKSGTYTTTDTFGRGTFTVSKLQGSDAQDFIYYVVDSGHVQVLADAVNAADPGNVVFVGSGPMYAQAGAPSGAYVFTVDGLDGAGANDPLNNFNVGVSLLAGGLFSVNSTNVGSALLDVNDGGLVSVSGGQGFTAALTTLKSGRGTMTITYSPALQPGFTFPTVYAYYPTTHGILLVDISPIVTNSNTGANGGAFTDVGLAIPQDDNSITLSTLNGNYALNLTNGYVLPTGGQGEVDVSGQAVATPNTNNSTGAFAGIVDVDGFDQGSAPGLQLTGSFGVPSISPTPGRSTGSFVLPLPAPASTQTLNEIFYIADGNTALFIDTDAATATTGVLEIQSSQ